MFKNVGIINIFFKSTLLFIIVFFNLWEQYSCYYIYFQLDKFNVTFKGGNM